MNNSIKISTVTTLKAPLEITLSFVRYHLNIGIDHMYLFFDDPNDEAISHLKDQKRVTLIKCDQTHWDSFDLDPKSEVQTKQVANATHAFQLARKSGFEWLIHMDSDELIYGSTSVKDYFRQIPEYVDVIRFPVLEASPQQLKHNNAFKEITNFKVYTAISSQVKNFSMVASDKKEQNNIFRRWHYKRRIARLFGSNTAARQKFILGHNVGKSATRTSAPIKKISNHLPIPEKGANPNLIVSQSFYVLHYDCMGFHNWRSKWENRINGDHNFNHQRLSRFRLELTKKIENALHNEDQLKSLYYDLYYLSSYEYYLLKMLGLLKKVDLSSDLFEKQSK